MLTELSRNQIIQKRREQTQVPVVEESAAEPEKTTVKRPKKTSIFAEEAEPKTEEVTDEL